MSFFFLSVNEFIDTIGFKEPGIWNNRIKQTTNSFWIFIGRTDAEAEAQ